MERLAERSVSTRPGAHALHTREIEQPVPLTLPVAQVLYEGE